MSHSQEIRDRARAMYVSEGKTFEEVSRATGVDASTLWRWSKAEGWRRQRDDLRADLSDIRASTIQLRKRLIQRVLAGLSGESAVVDPQQIYAVSALEGATAKLTAVDDAVEMPAPVDREIRTPADAVGAVQDAIQARINQMLSQPDALTLQNLRDLKAALGLVEEIRAAFAGDEDKGEREGLSPELESRLVAILKGEAE